MFLYCSKNTFYNPFLDSWDCSVCRSPFRSCPSVKHFKHRHQRTLVAFSDICCYPSHKTRMKVLLTGHNPLLTGIRWLFAAMPQCLWHWHADVYHCWQVDARWKARALLPTGQTSIIRANVRLIPHLTSAQPRKLQVALPK